MPIFRRDSKNRIAIASDGVLWGVARREASSDRDDPVIHAKLVQHAFELGVDERAICGFRPPVRVGFDGTSRHPPLAIPGPENPRCPSCVSLLGLAVTPESEAISPVLLATAEGGDGDDPGDGVSEEGEIQDGEDAEVAPLEETSEVAESFDAADEPADVDANARDSTWAPRRSSARRGGRVTVPPGRRTIVASVPDRLRGLAVAANVEDPKSPVRVQSVAVGENGEITITLNQRAVAPVEVVWFVVSGPHRT